MFPLSRSTLIIVSAKAAAILSPITSFAISDALAVPSAIFATISLSSGLTLNAACRNGDFRSLRVTPTTTAADRNGLTDTKALIVSAITIMSA